jgi:large subunit ribosomal protein L6e
MVKNKNAGKSRNYALASGVYRFGKSKTYHKKAIYKFLKKKTVAPAKSKKATFVEKQVGMNSGLFARHCLRPFNKNS